MRHSVADAVAGQWRADAGRWAGLSLERPRIMGVVNVTPDSFSDGGRYFDAGAAIAAGLAMADAGADIVDVGGESTRPGSPPTAPDEESQTPETLAELAGLAFGAAGAAGAAGVAAEAASMPPVNPAPAEPPTPEIAHADEVIPHASHLLKRIRVTRQIKVNGEIIEETSAEALIDADADPEPVRERLRQQLHSQAASRMAELGITEDQGNS